jgi:hypothetical protein
MIAAALSRLDSRLELAIGFGPTRGNHRLARFIEKQAQTGKQKRTYHDHIR